jgi:chaperonin GroEL (HSP60 family)
LKIQYSDIIKALKLAYQHISVRSAIVSHEDTYRVVSNVGLLVNSRPPVELSDSQSHVFQMSLEHARRAEINSAGSSLAMLALTQRMLLDSTLRVKTMVEGRTFIEADLPNIIDGILDSNEKSEFIEFIQLAGASKYLVDRAPSRFNSIEFVDNYEFVHVSKAVDGIVNMDSARVLIADAYIENESEIHKLLEWSGKEKERLLLCCRGFSDDVIHTLAINRARGTLSAYALAFPFDENDANTLVDIATIVGGDIVSSLKGQLISTLEPASMPRIHYARLRGNVLELNDPSARKRTDHLANNIREKLETCEIEAREPLERRLKRLNGTTMIVRLKAGPDHSFKYEKWDLALRTIRAAVRGVVETNDSEMWPNRKLVPLLSEATAYQYARKLVHKLDELSFIV